MVYVNSRKFACGSCIKGHRSSSCHHTDRPLFEIKKKGRPVSQCTKCRDLRKNKRMHVKCSCTGILAAGPSVLEVDEPKKIHRPNQRKVPSVPTLPNGLKDLVTDDAPSIKSNPKQRVVHLLNPCECRSLWDCRCTHGSSSKASNAGSNQKEANLDYPTPRMSPASPVFGRNFVSQQNVGYPFSPPPREDQPLLISKLTSAHTSSTHMVSSYENDFVPLPSVILDNKGFSGSSNFQILPSLKEVPRLSTHSRRDDLQLDKCGCGNICACPGCKEHRESDVSDISGEDCPDNCSSCVDRAGGLALPIIPPYTIKNHSIPFDGSKDGVGHECTIFPHGNTYISPLDEFHTVAALIPPPPPSRALVSRALDATNLAVYQANKSSNWQKAAGFVQLPRLKCCGGSCICPMGGCRCRVECDGRCRLQQTQNGVRDKDSEAELKKQNGNNPSNEETRGQGCCISKKANRNAQTSP